MKSRCCAASSRPQQGQFAPSSDAGVGAPDDSTRLGTHRLEKRLGFMVHPVLLPLLEGVGSVSRLIELARIGLGEFAAQLEIDDGADRWFRLIVPEPIDPAMVAQQLGMEIDVVLGSGCQLADAGTGPLALVRLVRAAGEQPVVLYGVDCYSDADWLHVDLLRSAACGRRSQSPACPTFCTTKMESCAPNLSSFGGATWQVDLESDYLSETEQQARLVLRTALGYSDADVIEMAEGTKLPDEPEFAEWLVLLGRGRPASGETRERRTMALQRATTAIAGPGCEDQRRTAATGLPLSALPSKTKCC